MLDEYYNTSNIFRPLTSTLVRNTWNIYNQYVNNKTPYQLYIDENKMIIIQI